MQNVNREHMHGEVGELNKRVRPRTRLVAQQGLDIVHVHFPH